MMPDNKDKCKHKWITDGQHSNEYCKRCFISKEIVEKACQNRACILFDEKSVGYINCLDGLNYPCRLHTATPTESITVERRERLDHLLSCCTVQISQGVISCGCPTTCRDCNDNNKLTNSIEKARNIRGD